MSALPKYHFDLEFGENGEIINQVEEKEDLEEHEDLPPPEPTFSLAELQDAREEGHRAGREEMRAEAEAATETSAMLALTALAEHFAGLSAAQEAAISEIRREAVVIALAVTRKMFPNLAQDMALPEIESVIHTCLREYITEPRIFVRVHEDVRDLVKEKADPIVEQTGFQGDLIVVAEPGLGRSDCVLEWGAGGAERRTERLWQNIDREVADALGVAVEELEAFPWGPGAEAPLDEDTDRNMPEARANDTEASELAVGAMPATEIEKPAEGVDLLSENAPAETPEAPEAPQASMADKPGTAIPNSLGGNDAAGDGMSGGDRETETPGAEGYGGVGAITQKIDDGVLADSSMIGDLRADDPSGDDSAIEIPPPGDPENPQG